MLLLLRLFGVDQARLQQRQRCQAAHQPGRCATRRRPRRPTAGQFAPSTAVIARSSTPTHPAPPPLADALIYTAVANLSIVTLTWSLKYNDLFVYQLSKLARVPVTCLLELLFFRKLPTLHNVCAGTAVLAGVGLA